MSTDAGQTVRQVPGLRITLDDIAAVLEEASQRAGQAAAPTLVGADAPPPENAALIQRLAALAGELRDVSNQLKQLGPSTPPANGGTDQPKPT